MRSQWDLDGGVRGLRPSENKSFSLFRVARMFAQGCQIFEQGCHMFSPDIAAGDFGEKGEMA